MESTIYRYRPVAGLVAFLAVLPRLAIAMEAYNELGHLPAVRFRLIDFQPAHWVTLAFLAAHAWLLWALASLFREPHQKQKRVTWLFAFLVALAVSTVYAIYFAIRRHGVSFF